MGIWIKIKEFFGKKALQSDATALQSDATALQSDLNQQEQISLQKESLELGLAAGYTSHFIKNIESSLNRIETQMLTKDWFNIQLTDVVGKKLDSIQNSLDNLLKLSQTVPEPFKTQLASQIKKLQEQLPITPKMIELLSIVKRSGSISYEDLANALSIKTSALRGLLSHVIQRTDKIERFKKGTKGWVRFTVPESDFEVPKSDLMALQSALNQPEMLLREQFENIVTAFGYTISQRFYQTSPDFILLKDEKKIAVEIKSASDASILEKALGQLIYAKESLLVQELWLVLPESVSKPSEDWIKIFDSKGIKVFSLSESGLEEIRYEEKDRLTSQIKLFSTQEPGNQ